MIPIPVQRIQVLPEHNVIGRIKCVGRAGPIILAGHIALSALTSLTDLTTRIAHTALVARTALIALVTLILLIGLRNTNLPDPAVAHRQLTRPAARQETCTLMGIGHTALQVTVLTATKGNGTRTGRMMRTIMISRRVALDVSNARPNPRRSVVTASTKGGTAAGLLKSTETSGADPALNHVGRLWQFRTLDDYHVCTLCRATSGPRPT